MRLCHSAVVVSCGIADVHGHGEETSTGPTQRAPPQIPWMLPPRLPATVATLDESSIRRHVLSHCQLLLLLLLGLPVQKGSLNLCNAHRRVDVTRSAARGTVGVRAGVLPDACILRRRLFALLQLQDAANKEQREAGNDGANVQGREVAIVSRQRHVDQHGLHLVDDGGAEVAHTHDAAQRRGAKGLGNERRDDAVQEGAEGGEDARVDDLYSKVRDELQGVVEDANCSRDLQRTTDPQMVDRHLDERHRQPALWDDQPDDCRE
mmetsp:Transcript_126759/g.316792  ORF Transcript_126759/g.316792 Transcript_126759/m.316792 type:complete len:264 (-) Transcript_126759:925-1716(-)